MLEIKGLDKFFNRHKKNQLHVINQMSLTLEDVGLVALLGPSGCGKTTFLNTIGGLDAARSGGIYLNGEKINSKFMFQVDKMRNLRMGYIFQDYKLIDDKSVYDNVALVLTMVGIRDKKEIKKRVEYLLDKVGMLRYQRRPAGMLSGGERQRVGIARALAKDPEIILADEPTGNLDSKNSLEIMKIIKAISKEKLVILVTHEQDLAKFYASRIIEIEDGKIIADYENKHTDDLDYALDNCLYLKDFKEKEKLSEDVTLYSDKEVSIKLDVVVRGNNIYIQSDELYKIEVVDQSSSIEMVDDHYKKIAKKDIDAYQFDFKNIINNQYKKKYASIIRPVQMIVQGFKKVFAFSFIKKLLLLGFFISAMFIMYSFSTLFSCFIVYDEDFVTKNKEYLSITAKQVTVSDYLDYESRESVSYLLPGNSDISMELNSKDYYQTSQYPMPFSGSLSSLELLKEKDVIEGRIATEKHEIVIDSLVVKSILNGQTPAQMRGIYSGKDLLGRTVSFDHMNDFTIVGIVQTESPSIYVDPSQMLSMLAYKKGSGENYQKDQDSGDVQFVNYQLYQDIVEVRKGRMPTNDYEVMVPVDQAEQMPLNKKIKTRINGQELTVVGYYYSSHSVRANFVNANMIKFHLITSLADITVYCKDKQACFDDFSKDNLNIVDSYEHSKTSYMNKNKERLQNTLLVSVVILIISFIEIILMIRSSFLSRIKEIGIYRAIGVKKSDIYKMFFGEIFAITTLASIPGILLMAYILQKLAAIPLMKTYIYMSPIVVILAIITVYLFNIIIGLLPVYNTIKKRPAVILARSDLD